MNVSNFFNELKRRNVYKVAVAYAVVAWLLVQAGSRSFREQELSVARAVHDRIIKLRPAR
jgi:hypothetical protein